MKYEIKNRWTGAVIFAHDGDSLRAAVEAAIRSGVSLRGSDLRGSNLSGSNLRGSDLRDSNLRGSDLRGSDLSGSNLRGSNLSGSNLRGSDLSGSNLRGSNLSGSNLRGSDLTPIKADFYLVLLDAIPEIPALRQSLVEGRVDGSTYEGECACLVGTIANVRHCAYDEVLNIKPDSTRPIESFFCAIKKGDTPETNQASALAVQWLDEFTSKINPQVQVVAVTE